MPNCCSEEKARRGTPLLLGRARYSDTPELGLRFRGCHVQDRFLVGHNVFSVDVDAHVDTLVRVDHVTGEFATRRLDDPAVRRGFPAISRTAGETSPG